MNDQKTNIPDLIEKPIIAIGFTNTGQVAIMLNEVGTLLLDPTEALDIAHSLLRTALQVSTLGSEGLAEIAQAARASQDTVCVECGEQHAERPVGQGYGVPIQDGEVH